MRGTTLASFLTSTLLTAALHGAAPVNLVSASLSPETRMLLIQEMRALSTSMAQIHGALVMGDHATVRAEAKAIHDGFVLSQNLSEDQRHEIHTRLPEAFLGLDEQFHGMAAELTAAGERGDPHLERFWFEEMTRVCQDCHRRFAAGRFPGLADNRLDTGSHQE